MLSDLHFSPSDSTGDPTEEQLGPSVAEPLAIARLCAGRGWPVHPLVPGRKTPAGNCAACRVPGHTHENCPCPAAGRWCHGFRAATLDAARIDQWWGRHPHMGVGVSCGPADLVVIDVDAHHAPQPAPGLLLPGITIADAVDTTAMTTGYHTLAVLAALRAQPNPADDASTLRVRTPSGGLHIWYRATDGSRWRSSSGSGAGRGLAWQVDVRANGGYIIAPGTTTTAGTYQPVGESRLPAPLPGWLAQELDRTGHLPAAPTSVPAPRPVPPRARQAVQAEGGGRDEALRVLTRLLADVADCSTVSEGAGFSDKLNRAAFTAGGLVAAGHLSQHTAERALQETAELARPGQQQRAAQIIRSGMNAGARRPLHPGSRT